MVWEGKRAHLHHVELLVFLADGVRGVYLRALNVSLFDGGLHLRRRTWAKGRASELGWVTYRRKEVKPPKRRDGTRGKVEKSRGGALPKGCFRAFQRASKVQGSGVPDSELKGVGLRFRGSELGFRV